MYFEIYLLSPALINEYFLLHFINKMLLFNINEKFQQHQHFRLALIIGQFVAESIVQINVDDDDDHVDDHEDDDVAFGQPNIKKQTINNVW